jgi:hypothetical protein
LDDFQQLAKAVSPTAKDFLDNCFLTSRVTKNITNIDWDETDDLLVKSSTNSGIDRRDLSLDGCRSNVTVETRALRVDWIKNPCYNHDYPGYGSVYKILS